MMSENVELTADERAVLGYLIETRRWKGFNDISMATGILDLDETLNGLYTKGFIYFVNERVCITHTGEDAIGGDD